MTNTNPLRDQLATAIWSVHRDNPREAILDGVMEIMRRREVEAAITELTQQLNDMEDTK